MGGIDHKEYKVTEILEGGSQILLNDGSQWKIAPYFKKEIFKYWRHGDVVRRREASDDPQHPFTLYNLEENLEVAAQKIK